MGDGIEISLAETTDICSDDEDNDNDSSSSRASDDERQSSAFVNAVALVMSDMRRNCAGKELSCWW